MIKIEYIYKKNDTKNTKSGSCVLCIILYFYRIFKIRVFCICQPWSFSLANGMRSFMRQCGGAAFPAEAPMRKRQSRWDSTFSFYNDSRRPEVPKSALSSGDHVCFVRHRGAAAGGGARGDGPADARARTHLIGRRTSTPRHPHRRLVPSKPSRQRRRHRRERRCS